MKKRVRYKGYLITAQAVEHEPTPLGHRRFGACFSIAGASTDKDTVPAETAIDSVFVSPTYAANYAMVLARQHIDVDQEMLLHAVDAPSIT